MLNPLNFYAMANMCDSNYKIVGDSSDVNALYNLMCLIDKTKENGRWIGHIVEALNNGSIPEHIYARGWWDDLRLEENCISFQTESAWVSIHETWDYISSKYESLSAYFSAEEPGCEIYLKRDNDSHDFPDNYYLDALTPQNNYINEHFSTIDEALAYIKSNIDENVSKTEDITALNSRWTEEDEDFYIYLHEFDEV